MIPYNIHKHYILHALSSLFKEHKSYTSSMDKSRSGKRIHCNTWHRYKGSRLFKYSNDTVFQILFICLQNALESFMIRSSIDYTDKIISIIRRGLQNMILKLRKPVDKCRTSVRRYVQTKHGRGDIQIFHGPAAKITFSSFTKLWCFSGSGLLLDYYLSKKQGVPHSYNNQLSIL